jgi:hypothetical protein
VRLLCSACLGGVSVGCGEVVARPIGAPSTLDASFADAVTRAETAPPRDGAGARDAPSSTDASAADGSASFCTGTGPIPIKGDQCAGDIARRFRFAACACESLAISGTLRTYSFDSAVDAGTGNGASVGANGRVAANGRAVVGGSIWAGARGLSAGTPAVSLQSPSATSSVAVDVESSGEVTTAGTVLVGGDVYAGGGLDVTSGSLTVTGTVHVPDGGTTAGLMAGGGVLAGPVSVAPPCDCTAPVSVASLVTAHASSNDDRDAGLTVTSLDDPASLVAIPCGIFYVDGIRGDTPVSLDVTGRAALFVDGDLDAEQGLVIRLETGAELDLFVSGNVTLKGGIELNAGGPAGAMRVYVGGTALTLEADATVHANVYAMGADVQMASDFEMSGSLFARSLEFSGNFTVGYDVEVLRAPGCTPPGASCATCDDCPSTAPACKGGSCAPCVTTADCCAPLECEPASGACLPPIQ